MLHWNKILKMMLMLTSMTSRQVESSVSPTKINKDLRFYFKINVDVSLLIWMFMLSGAYLCSMTGTASYGQTLTSCLMLHELTDRLLFFVHFKTQQIGLWVHDRPMLCKYCPVSSLCSCCCFKEQHNLLLFFIQQMKRREDERGNEMTEEEWTEGEEYGRKRRAGRMVIRCQSCLIWLYS